MTDKATQKNRPATGQETQQQREQERLAQALRANLLRRKQAKKSADPVTQG